MAKVYVTVTVISAVLFLFLTLSQARVPQRLSESDIVAGSNELSASSSSAESDHIIRLPSDAVSAEPDPDSESDSETKDSSEHVAVASVPLNLVRFRPINRHFLFRSRFPNRPCHHHHHHHRLNNGLFKPVEVPYGDDMILSGGENGDFDPMMFHRNVQRTPARWVRLHHRNHHHRHHDHDDENLNGSEAASKFVFKHSDRFGKDKFRKHWRHENEEENVEDKPVKKNKKGGFMKRIRKILDHF